MLHSELIFGFFYCTLLCYSKIQRIFVQDQFKLQIDFNRALSNDIEFFLEFMHRKKSYHSQKS